MAILEFGFQNRNILHVEIPDNERSDIIENIFLKDETSRIMIKNASVIVDMSKVEYVKLVKE